MLHSHGDGALPAVWPAERTTTCINRYSTIVNNMLVDDKKELRAFNIACDGHFLPSIINHFQSAIENYPKAKCGL